MEATMKSQVPRPEQRELVEAIAQLDALVADMHWGEARAAGSGWRAWCVCEGVGFDPRRETHAEAQADLLAHYART